MIVVTQTGWLAMLDAMALVNSAIRIRLYVNDFTPSETDTFADYVEASFDGYTGYHLLVWGLAFINGSNQGQINAAQVAWIHDAGSSGELVYGIFVTNAADELQFAERFSAAVSMSQDGDTIEYTTQLTMIDQ